MTTPTPSETPTPRTDAIDAQVSGYELHEKVREYRNALISAERENQRLREQIEKLSNSLITSPDGEFLCGHSVMVAYDKLMTKSNQWQKCAQELAEALKGLTEYYCQLINSGDCGNWNPETDQPVIAARAALRKAGEL